MGGSVGECKKLLWLGSTHREMYRRLNRTDGRTFSFPLALEWRRWPLKCYGKDKPWELPDILGRLLARCWVIWLLRPWNWRTGSQMVAKSTTTDSSKCTTCELSKQDGYPLHPVALDWSLIQELSMRCLGPEDTMGVLQLLRTTSKGDICGDEMCGRRNTSCNVQPSGDHCSAWPFSGRSRLVLVLRKVGEIPSRNPRIIIKIQVKQMWSSSCGVTEETRLVMSWSLLMSVGRSVGLHCTLLL